MVDIQSKSKYHIDYKHNQNSSQVRTNKIYKKSIRELLNVGVRVEKRATSRVIEKGKRENERYIMKW